MEQKTKRVLNRLRSYAIITFGLLLYAVGWSLFMIPSGLVGGGITGIAAVIYYATGFPVSWSFFLINAILLAIALKILGKGFGVKTVFAIVAVTLFLDRLPGLIPVELIEDVALGNGKLLSAMMGGVFSGAGIAITFTQGGSTGGTDIIALMINKYRNISPGKLILYMDIFIILSSLAIPSQASIGERAAIIIYGFVLISVTSYTVDLILSGARQSIQIFIFSQKYEQIADAITPTGRGVTVIDGMGWFTKKEGKILMLIVRRTESNFVFRLVKDIDKDAFLSVGNVMGVYGKGFEEIKK
ncbi:MAG: YitT family protein [Bacteroidales bacterium]|nr:YitT family protein [Bacteroidales bacterium]MDD4057536.1 YitT family protein [Bacteroidales bacterium]